MTAPNLNYLIAGNHVTEMRQEAESARRVQEAHPRRERHPLARLFARRATRVIDLDLAAIAAQKP